ncbi:MAG: tRNA lysidine(34) synthetase TilS [Pseudomonadota bacterium]|nr:tRNA lysidine(34) synthetase TilS [Pseudomonadota bacterium]
MVDAAIPSPHLPAGAETAASGLLAGLSGGLDSTVLLHLLAAAPGLSHLPLRALHVCHGLDPAAERWIAHCQAACEALSVPLEVVRVEVARDSGLGLEGAARAVRHAAFEARLGAGEVLVLGHHADDQAETFLLRALRASGPDGLAAMSPWRRHASGWLWRPLLGHSRDALLAHARRHGLRWIDDPSNADTSLDRNFLRHEVMPLLRRRWPGTDAAFARSAALCAEASGLLDDEDARALAAALASADTVRVDALAMHPPARRARVLRRWCAGLGLPPLPGNGVAHIENDLLQAAADSDAAFEWSGARVRRWRNLLHAGPAHAALPADWNETWTGEHPLALPGGGTLRLLGAERFDVAVRVHARQGGERIRLPGRDHHHALKHVLQERGVPPWLRERLPLLSAGDGSVLAAGDLALADGFDQWLRGHGASIAWQP